MEHGHHHDHHHDDHGHDHDNHEHDHGHHEHHDMNHQGHASSAFNLPPLPADHKGLEETTSQLKRSQRSFININNNLGINMFKASLQDDMHKKSNFLLSLVSATTSLAMVFLGARGVTSWQINELLR